MAINWLAKDAARAIQEGKVENLLDIGKRFPLFSILAAQTNEAGLKLIDTLPKYVTARTIEAVLKGDAVAATGTDEDEEGAPADPTPAKPTGAAANPTKAAASKAAPAPAAYVAPDYTGKTAKELFVMAGERGLTVVPRQPVEIYLKQLKTDDAAKKKAADAAIKAASAAAAKTPKADDDDWGEPAAAAQKPAAAKADDDWDIS